MNRIMQLIFCADPLAPSQPDPEYSEEWHAARAAGFKTAVLDIEALHAGDAPAAIRRVAASTATIPALYRGWMLPVQRYGELAVALAAQQIELITGVDAYRLTHELPGWYALLADQTPRSVWLPWSGQLDMPAIMRLLEPFGERPLVLKDYVKSRKHEWHAACFIAHASDAAAVERVVRRFVELQGSDLSGGLVFREYIALRQLGPHPRSGMPIAEEYRLFFFDGALLAVVPYWEQQPNASATLPLEHCITIAGRIASRFFTMDLARRDDGGWIVVELGDGQVAGLPEQTDLASWYRALAAAYT